MKTFSQYVLEDIELAGPKMIPKYKETERDGWTPERLFNDTAFTKTPRKVKNLGQIAKGYSLVRKDGPDDELDDDGRPKANFYIIHDKTKKPVGFIGASDGGKGKKITISWVLLDPKHGKKELGYSLPVAAYKALHKDGYTVQSDSRQSIGGASIWKELMRDREVSRHVRARRDGEDIGTASKVDDSEIWAHENETGRGGAFPSTVRKAEMKGIRASNDREKGGALRTRLVLQPKSSAKKSSVADTKKPGQTWETKSKVWGGKNREGIIRYFENKTEAQDWARK